NRPGNQEEEPAAPDLHHRVGQRLQRLPADSRAAQAGRLRNLAGPVQLSGSQRGHHDNGDAFGPAESSGPVIHLPFSREIVALAVIPGRRLPSVLATSISPRMLPSSMAKAVRAMVP